MKKEKRNVFFAEQDDPSFILLKLDYAKDRIPLSAREWDLLHDALWDKAVSLNDCLRILEKARTEEERTALKKIFITLEFLDNEEHPWNP